MTSASSAPSTLRDILARSSNIGAARLALRIGGERQRAYLTRLGLLAQPTLELARSQAPIAPVARTRRDIAGLGFGYGLAATPASLAGAYTVFVNNGARVAPTLLMRSPDAPVDAHTGVFAGGDAASAELHALGRHRRHRPRRRRARACWSPAKPAPPKSSRRHTYAEDHNFSSFAGVFPVNDPRYVIFLALDDTGAGAAGGAVAAPAVARTLRRIAPMLGLRVEPRPPTH